MISSQQNAGLILPNTKLTFRILQNDEIAMGPGKAELLQAIADTGSISAAGRSMRMSYRRAWLLVDVMNRSFKQPLVETSKSGKKGRGAGLTPFGKQVLKNYQTRYAPLIIQSKLICLCLPACWLKTRRNNRRTRIPEGEQPSRFNQSINSSRLKCAPKT
ncbi:MAG: winged helix-turn-helix domain-containing protein [Methylomonas sp.]